MPLSAGGFPVHKIARGASAPEPREVHASEGVSILERYQDLAAILHRTAIAPRGDRYIWGCTCGEAGLVFEEGMRAAQLVTAKHVLDKASELYERLEHKLALELPRDD